MAFMKRACATSEVSRSRGVERASPRRFLEHPSHKSLPSSRGGIVDRLLCLQNTATENLEIPLIYFVPGEMVILPAALRNF